jgi:predicted lipid-binding transport protein (Tim44 family)
MKKAVALFALVLTIGMTAALDAEAKRLGGGKSGGMQRQAVTAPANPGGAAGAVQGAPRQAAPAAGAAAAAAPAAAANRSWMGPLAGLAAGLGLAALASHLGFGEALANMMLIGLLVMAAVVVIGLVMRKRAAGRGPALAAAGAAGGSFQPQAAPTLFRGNDAAPQAAGGSMIGSGLASGAAVGSIPAGSIPADFDRAAFERNARDQFMALQSANDAGDLDRLRDYLTPEMFELARAELAARGDATQNTEVFGLQAQVVDVAEEADRYVVSVRFTGSTRDQAGAVPEDLDETWHLVKPRTGMGGWTIAGIQQSAA